MRDRLIELCDKKIDTMKFQNSDHWWDFTEKIKEIADYLIANGVTVGDANNATTTWRPASEPPKEDGAYLVSLTSFSGKHTWQDVCKFANNLEKVDNFDFKGIKRAGWYSYKDGDYYEIDDITHWQPLPEPPKEVE